MRMHGTFDRKNAGLLCVGAAISGPLRHAAHDARLREHRPADYPAVSFGTPQAGRRTRPALRIARQRAQALALAYCSTGVHGQLIELLVDFDKLTPEMIEDVTPARYRWAA